jgi:TolB-like protein/lipoprotein NlpI
VPPAAPERLDSWKEIAAYLQRDVRTLHRWERAEGLPVHRHLHQKRGTVYAYPAELDAWREGRTTQLPARSAAADQRVMLAVLPFANLSGQGDQDYFSDGLTEELITYLGRSHLDRLGVIARTSVMRYKASDKDIGQIGRELGVDYVLEGSVRREARRVRITGQLIRVSDQTHVWADSYDRDLRQVLTLQTEIARAVAQEVGLKLGAPEPRTASGRGVDPQAYEAYLKGRFHWYKLRPENLDTALEYFDLALRKDPTCALAHVGIALVWFSRGDCGLIAPREAFPRSRDAALKAVALDDTLAEAHDVLGLVRCCYEWDWQGAEAEYRRAIDLNPSYADARLMWADLLIATGRAREAGAELAQCLELDPLNFFFRCFFGWHLLYSNRYDEAVAQLRLTLKAEPQFPAAHLGLWGALYRQRKYPEALQEAKRFFALQGRGEIVDALDDGGGKAGYPGAMRRAAEKMVARSERSYVGALGIARVYAHAGEKDRALQWLERAYEERVPGMCHLAVAWDWHGLHGERRFQRLLRRMKLPAPLVA